MRSDGADRPARLRVRSRGRIRGPSFPHVRVLPATTDGECIPDLIVSLGSLDAAVGEVDR
jgi:NADH-quinone oxidoreductase subunit C/D